ncbi:hypothetical protein AAK706_08650 [Erysipelotrichaceae bacterium 66-17]
MIEKIKENKWLVIGMIFIFAYFLIRFSQVDLTFGDDPWFRNYIDDGVFNFIGWRWNTWSSRIILEGILLIMLKFPSIIWRIITSLMLVLMDYSILKLLSRKQSLFFNIAVTVMLLSVDFSLYGGAGWYATTINYIWVFGLGIYVLSFIPALLKNEKIKGWQWFTIGVSVLISSNQEQMCALLVGFYGVALLWNIFITKKKNACLLFVFGICMVMLLIHLSCPGNAIRKVTETQAYFPKYDRLGLFQKVYIGIMTTIAPFLRINNFQVIVYFISLIILSVITKNKKIISISFVPIILYGIMRYIVKYTTIPMFNSVLLYLDSNGKEIGIPQISKSAVLIFIVIVAIACLCIYITIKTCSKTTWIVCALLLAAAFCSRVILGFSASVFESGMRTLIFTYYLIGICDLYLINAIYTKKLIRRKTT